MSAATLPSTDEAAPFVLTEQQKSALDKMWLFLESLSKLFLLLGYAGTGKSTCIFILIQFLLAQNKRIALCAPTNKAVDVLREVASRQDIHNLEFYTIYQLLGLGVVSRNGEKVVEQTGTSYLHSYDVVFIDESSMIGKMLWHWIESAAENTLSHTKFILMGDPAQLNPVGERRSPCFKIKERARLTEVVRRQQDNPLLQYLTSIRQSIKHNAAFKPYNHCANTGRKGATLTNRKALLKYACTTFRKYFDDNPNRFRILCWSNAQVDWYNQRVRRSIYGRAAARFVAGERLITRAPVLAPDNKTIILTTSSEFTIAEVHEDFYHNHRAWRLVIRLDDQSLRQIYVLHESEQARFDQESDRLKKNAQRNHALWKQYYSHLEKFASVRSCYALTIHNSQGSTYDEAAIDAIDVRMRLNVGDGSKAFRIAEYNRLHYVGSSRAKQRILIATTES